MARPAGLIGAGVRWRSLLGLLVAVLVAHALVFDWLARQWVETTALRPLVTPMFTRLLQPQTPPAPVFKQIEAAAPPARARPAIKKVAKRKTVPATTSTVAALEPPDPPPLQTGEAPAPPSDSLAGTGDPAVDTEAAATAATVDTAPDVSNASENAAGGPVPATGDATASTAGSATPTITVAASTPASSSSTATLDVWPGATRLNYRLSGQFRSGELYGDARVHWQRDGDTYQTRVEIDLTMLVNLVLTSQGQVTPQGLVPRVYEEVRRNKVRSAKLGETAITLADGRLVPRPGGVQDTASQFVELGHRFASGRELLEVGRSVTLWMARPGAVDQWTYDIVEREMLKTPQLGDVEAFRLRPRPLANPRGNITAEMWFAPSLQYLPVRIRVRMGDEATVDMLVDTIEQR